MGQSSAPIVDVNLSDADWRDLGLGRSGVVSDYDGSAYALTLPTDSDVLKVGSTTQRSVAHVANFVHRIPVNETVELTIPAASGSPRTDLIALRYDPTYTGAPGPVRLVRITGATGTVPGADDVPPGVEELALWAITRAPGQSLAAATKRQLFPRLAPALDLPPGGDLPSAPLGTVAWSASVIYRRVLDANQVPAWVPDKYIQASAPSSAADGAIWFQAS